MIKEEIILNKDAVVNIAVAMGFHLDYDQWDVDGKEWMRFELSPELDEQNLRLIWYKGDGIEFNLRRASTILFKAGQKAKIKQLNEFIDL